MNTTKFGEIVEKVLFFLASNLVGITFVLMGVLATLSISERGADICNIWSLIYIIGLWLSNSFDLYGRIARKTTPKNAKKHRGGWKFAIEFGWMVLSILCAIGISNLLWIGREPKILEFTTNGCSLFVMGITSFMLYQNYTE